jgi:hypothetical protein
VLSQHAGLDAEVVANADVEPFPSVAVLRELEALQQLGLVTRDDSRSGVGGRWKVTATARPYPAEQPKVRPKNEPPDPGTVLAEVTTFVNLARPVRGDPRG